MSKIRKEFRLTEETLSQIREYGERKGIDDTKALTELVALGYRGTPDIDDIIVEKILAAFDAKYKNLFTRLRLGIRTADINSQIALEVLNTLAVNMNVKEKDVVTTDFFTNPSLKKSKEVVLERVASAKQKKDHKEKGKA